MKHTHETHDIKPPGECPACDDLRARAEGVSTYSSRRRAAEAAEFLRSVYPGPYSKEEKASAAALFKTGRSSVERMLGIHARSVPIFERVKKGEMSIAEASRRAGFIEYNSTKIRTADGLVLSRGDRFWEGIGPMRTYLKGWEKRDYEFSHLTPKEAARRLAKIEQIIPMLEKVKEDLTIRADDSRLSLRK